MPLPVPPGLKLGYAEPKDAVAAFVRRALLQPTFRWQDVWQEEHARGFSVAGVAELDVLLAFKDEVERAVSEGRSLQDFSDRMQARLVEKGWWGDVEIADPTGAEPPRLVTFNDARLRTIFEVNMRQSHAAGRWARVQRTKKRLPLLMYRTMHDERVRASHAAWDGLVLPVDHPFWRTHYPPNGWRCRCTAFATDERDVERRRAAGQTIRTEAPPVEMVPFVNRRTGEVTEVPAGIDPGFGYNPGISAERDAALDQVRQQRERGL